MLIHPNTSSPLELMDRSAKHRANFSPHDKYLLLNHLDKLASKCKLIVDSIFCPLYRLKLQIAMILRSQRLISVTGTVGQRLHFVVALNSIKLEYFQRQPIS